MKQGINGNRRSERDQEAQSGGKGYKGGGKEMRGMGKGEVVIKRESGEGAEYCVAPLLSRSVRVSFPGRLLGKSPTTRDGFTCL